MTDGSPAKKQRREKGGECPVCREQNCCGSYSKSACPESRFAGHPHRNEDTSKYPPHVREKIAELRKRRDGQAKKRPCNLFNTPQGCRFGDKCKYLHKKRTTAPPSSSVNSLAEGSLDTFTQFQQFLEFQRQSAQAKAAGAVSFEDDETNSISIDGRETHWRNFRFVVRDLKLRTHLGLFRAVTREIRLRAMLPCGRQGNRMLSFLLAHRFRAAAEAKMPTPLPTNRARAHGKRFPSVPHAVIQPTARAHAQHGPCKL